MPGVQLVTVPVPLRPGVDARLILPRDITQQEVNRIKNFLEVLEALFQNAS